MATLLRPDPYLATRQLAAVDQPVRQEERLLNEEQLAREAELSANDSRSETGRALNQGLEQSRAALIAARGLARIPFDEAGGVQDLRESQAISNRASELGPRVQNFDQVRSAGDFGEWLLNNTATQLPNIATTLGTGGLGGAGRVAAGSLIERAALRSAARGAAAGVAEREALQAGTQLAARDAAGNVAEQAVARAPRNLVREFEQGAAVGGAAGGALLQSSIAPDIVLDPNGSGTVKERAAKAAVGAVATGALEALPVLSMFRRYGLDNAAEQVSGGVLRRMATNAIEQGTNEAATELAQTFGERLAHKWVNDNVQVVGPDAYSDYLNAAAGGFFGGAVFGAPAGLRGAGNASPAYGRVRERVSEIVNKITPDFGTPGAPINTTGPAPEGPSGGGIGERFRNAEQATRESAQAVRDRVREFYDRNFGAADRESSVDLAVNEIFNEVNNAEPFNYTTENGTTIYNRPFNKFADEARARASVEAGVPVDLAVVASTVPQDREAALSRSGALRAASQALRGDALKSIDSAALREYADALTPEARRSFVRAAATMQELAAADQVQRDESGRAVNAQIATPPAETENDIARAGMSDVDVANTTTEETPLRDTTAIYRAVRGTPVRGQMATDAIGVVDARGVQRQTSPASIGRALAQIKSDQDFQDSTRTLPAGQRNVAAIAQLAADVAQNGGQLDLTSLRPGMKLGRDWTLVPADIAAINQALQADQFARRERGATQGPVTQATARQREAAQSATARQRERDLINDPGAIDPSEIDQVAGNEGVSEAENLRVLGPREGRPAELRVSDQGRVTEAQAQDVGNIDPEARRAENATQWGVPEMRARLDKGLQRVLGKRPDGARQRRQMIDEARKRLSGKALTQLNERVYEMSSTSAKNATDAYNVSRSEWQSLRREYARARDAGANPQELRAIAEQGEQARQAMVNAQARRDRQTETANRDRQQVQRTPKPPVRKPTPRTTDQTRVAGPGRPAQTGTDYTESNADRSAEGDAASSRRIPEAPKANSATNDLIAKSKSRRELDALAMRVVNAAGLTEAQRIETLQKIVDRKAELNREIQRAGARDIEEGNRTHEQSEEHFEAARKALAGKNTVQEALQAVRSLGNRRQRGLIDSLLATGALRNVKFATDHKAFGGRSPMEGRAYGIHNSTPQQRALDSVVAIKMAEWAQYGDQNTDIVGLLIHEATHAATSHAELTDASSRAALKQMLDHAREQLTKAGYDVDSWYGLAETQEFIAEAFGNADFQRLLESIPASGNSKFKNLWEQFKDFVTKLLGLDASQATALDEAITVGLDMARTTGEARANTLEAIFGLGEPTVEAAPYNLASTPASGARPSDYMTMLPPKERLYLMGAFSRGDVFRQIEAAVPANQRRLLQTADLGPQLLVNTGVALALSNRLDLQAGAKGAVSQVMEQIRKTLQIPSNRAYANQILEDIRGGRVNANYSARAQLLNPAVDNIMRVVDNKVAPVARAFASDIDDRMRTTGIPALTQLATLLSQRTGEFRADGSSSFTAARNRERGKRLNDFYKIIEGWSDEKKASITRSLQEQATQGYATSVKGGVTYFDPTDADIKKVYDFFREQHDYLTGAGIKLGKVDNYFPVTIDGEAIAKNKQDFIDLLNAPNLKQYTDAAGGADVLYDAAIKSTGRGEQHIGDMTFSDGKHDPNFRALNERVSDYIYKHGTPKQIEQFSKFQDPNLERVVVNYVNRATTRAEWERLGLGDRIKSLIEKAGKEGATIEQKRMARDYVDQIMGVYGQDWHPLIKRALEGADKVLGTKLADIDFAKAKGLQSALITYQNVRLLPLALASSLIDPLGGSVRSGGELRKQFQSMREAVRALRDSSGNNALREMAQDMGVVERNAVNEALIYLYGGAHDPSGRLAKINNALFKYNGLELVTKFSRLTALAMGHKFLLKHAAQGGNARYLTELGLKPSDVVDDGTGHVVRNEKIDEALARFVDESVVRPTPGQRPVWHNDPHFALAAQYKGYLYSFWNTVMRRAAVELRNGNYRVLAPLALYLPVTAFGELMRDVAQGDDDDRDMWDYSKLAVERSGLLGPKVNILQSAQQDVQFGSSAINSLLGPTGQQLSQMYDTLNGQRSLSKTAVEALPGSALYEEW